MAMLLRKTILFMIIFSGTVMAINFGSTTKGSVAQIEENGTAGFSLVFWSSDAENHTIMLSVQSNPNDLDVSLENREITVGALTGNEFVYSSGSYIRATSVGVTVENVRRGTHSIIISASMPAEGGQINVFQERLFNLTIVVGEKSQQIKHDIPESSPLFTPGTEAKNYYLLAIIAVILIVSFAIYKYS